MDIAFQHESFLFNVWWLPRLASLSNTSLPFILSDDFQDWHRFPTRGFRLYRLMTSKMDIALKQESFIYNNWWLRTWTLLSNTKLSFIISDDSQDGHCFPTRAFRLYCRWLPTLASLSNKSLPFIMSGYFQEGQRFPTRVHCIKCLMTSEMDIAFQHESSVYNVWWLPTWTSLSNKSPLYKMSDDFQDGHRFERRAFRL